MASLTPILNWERLFPDAAHRWQMGLRPGDPKAFFAREDKTGAILDERRKWFDSAPEDYGALFDQALPALGETSRFATQWGATVDDGEPLRALACAWEPDFVLMLRGDDGIFRLAGGAVCFPSSWALRDKIGKPLEEVHEPVPGLNTALARQIHTFLDRLAPGAAWARDNWGLSRDCELNHHPSRPRIRLDQTIIASEIWLRIERQLLFKLLGTGAILFGIRVDVHPFAEWPEAVRAGVAKAISTMPPAILAYKGLAAARDALLEICWGLGSCD